MMKRKLKAYVDSYHAIPDGIVQKKPKKAEEEQKEAMRQEFAQLLDWQIEKTVLIPDTDCFFKFVSKPISFH